MSHVPPPLERQVREGRRRLEAERERREWWQFALASLPAIAILSIPRSWITAQLGVSLRGASWLQWTIGALVALLGGFVLARIHRRGSGPSNNDRDRAV